MRIYYDVNRIPDTGPAETSSIILAALPDPPVGTMTRINGRFPFPVPDEIGALTVSSASRLLDNSVPADYLPGLVEAGLLRVSGKSNIVYNPLLKSADLSAFALAATFPPGEPCRYRFGRVGAATTGGVTIPAQNSYTVPVRPGLLLTSPTVAALPVSETVLYWKVYRVGATHEVVNYGTGDNTPAYKTLEELDPDELEVYVSADNGLNYELATTPLAPVAMAFPGADLILAFRNPSASDLVLASYALMY